MYERSRTVTLVTNASAIGNNLAVQFIPQTSKALTIGVIHEGYINVIPVYSSEMRAKYIPCVESGTRPRHVSTSVMQASYVVQYKKRAIVFCGFIPGIQIFDADGRSCKFSHPCIDTADIGSNFACGLALLGEDVLCVGNNTGTIRFFLISEDSDDVEQIQCKKIHEKAITDIATFTTKKSLVTSDESGALSLWKTDKELQSVYNFPIFGYPCTSLKIWTDFILCAYGSGHIRVFDSENLCLISEVAAHARWITAIDIAPETGYFLSVSEDSFVKVWQIGKENGKVTHKFSSQIEDSMLVGGRFLTSGGDKFCVTSYDSCDVICFAA